MNNAYDPDIINLCERFLSNPGDVKTSEKIRSIINENYTIASELFDVLFCLTDEANFFITAKPLFFDFIMIYLRIPQFMYNTNIGCQLYDQAIEELFNIHTIAGRKNFSHAYLLYYNRPNNKITFDFDFDHIISSVIDDVTKNKLAFDIILALIDQSTTERELYYIAAGPLEDYIRKFNLTIEPIVRKFLYRSDPELQNKLRIALGGVWAFKKSSPKAYEVLQRLLYGRYEKNDSNVKK